MRLRVATRGAFTITLALAGEWLFVGSTGALEEPAPAHASLHQLAAVQLQHHDMLVMAMLLGGLVALLCGLNANEPSAPEQTITVVFIGLVIAASLALGLWIGPHRLVALAAMVVLLVVGAYGRRFGQRGAVTGVILFIGYFYGFFLSSGLGEQAAGWLAAETGIAAAALVVRALLQAGIDLLELSAAARVARLRGEPAGQAAYRRAAPWFSSAGEAAIRDAATQRPAARERRP